MREFQCVLMPVGIYDTMLFLFTHTYTHKRMVTMPTIAASGPYVRSRRLSYVNLHLYCCPFRKIYCFNYVFLFLNQRNSCTPYQFYICRFAFLFSFLLVYHLVQLHVLCCLKASLLFTFSFVYKSFTTTAYSSRLSSRRKDVFVYIYV